MRRKKRATRRIDEQGFLSDDDGEDLQMHMEACSDCQVTLSGLKRCLPEMYPVMPMSWLHDEYEAIVWGKTRR